LELLQELQQIVRQEHVRLFADLEQRIKRHSSPCSGRLDMSLDMPQHVG
jgi:hypothetical protein